MRDGGFLDRIGLADGTQADTPAKDTALPMVDGSGFSCTPIKTPLSSPLQDLAAFRPKVQWASATNIGGVQSAVAISGDRVVVSAGHTAFFFDRTSGAAAGTYTNPNFTKLSGPVADAQGNFYFASDVGISVDRSAKERWKKTLRSDNAKEVPSSPFLLSPDGVLYSAQHDGYVKALAKDTGAILWEKPILVPSRTSAYAPSVMAGTADSIYLSFDPFEDGVRLLNRKTGTVISGITTTKPSPPNPSTWFLSLAGGYGVVLGYDLFTTKSKLVVSDPQLKSRWTIDNSSGLVLMPRYVDTEGNLVVVESVDTQGRPYDRYSLHKYSCSGASGVSVDITLPNDGYVDLLAVGADGLAYFYLGDHGDLGTKHVLVALNSGLSEVWRLDIGDRALPTTLFGAAPAAAVTDDGLLFFVTQRPTDGAAEVIAVKTTSPGPAKTPWNLARHDNGQTGWVP